MHDTFVKEENLTDGNFCFTMKSMAAHKARSARKVIKKPMRSEPANDPEVQKLREELFEAKEKLKEKEEQENPEAQEESTEETKESDVVASESALSSVEADSEKKEEEVHGEEDEKSEQELKEEQSDEKEQEDKKEQPEDAAAEAGNGSEEKSSKKSLLMLGIIFLFVGGIIGIFIFSSLQYFSNVQTDNKKEEVVPTIEPTATPTPEITYGTYQLQVLNGSGVSGQAASTAQSLEDALGFEANNVDVGNAADTVEDTTVQMKTAVPSEVFDAIKDNLSGFTVVAGDPLTDDNQYDIVVTLGSQQE